jgi:hypothetical protein
VAALSRLAGTLHVEETTLQRDYDCVRAIAGAEFGEDAFEVAFDRVLRDAKLFGDQLI